MLEELTLEELLALPATEGEDEHAEEEHAEELEDPNPVLPTGAEIIWAAIFFIALWAVMKYVLLPPIQKTRAERQAKINAAKDASEGASSDLASIQASYDAKIGDARAQAARILDDARAEAEAHRGGLIAEADAEIATLRAGADAELTSARAEALSSLRPQVAEVAAGAASSVVGRTFDSTAATSVVDRLLDGGTS